MSPATTTTRVRASGLLRLLGVIVLACAMLAADSGAGVAGATVRRGAEDAFVRLVNQSREAAGLRPLSADLHLTRTAREWTDTMARRGELSHNPDLGTQLAGSWGRLGENVGYTGHADAPQAEMVRRLHRSFMDSSGHRDNILGGYNRIGVGVHVTSDRTMWVTVVFGDGSSSGAPLFHDAGGSAHEDAIDRLWRDGVVTGCSRDRFCPDQALTRGQLATMLVRAVDGVSSASGTRFSDVRADDPHAAGIAGLAEAGAVIGCGRDRFCPDQPVSRAQMATMLVRAVDGLGQADPAFRDVARGSVHARYIGGVAAAGVADGCRSGRFCPHEPVTRGQAAAILARLGG